MVPGVISNRLFSIYISYLFTLFIFLFYNKILQRIIFVPRNEIFTLKILSRMSVLNKLKIL